MIEPKLLKRLERIVGAEYVSAGRADAEVYRYDASLAVGPPDAVVLPADTQQTAAVVCAACEARVPYVPRGFGTNLSGGSVACRGGLVIGLARLSRILAVKPEARYAVVQPGVTNLELQNALAPLGMFYAPDPASQKVATLGGNVGENAGGPHCLKYGVTTNHVLGMTVVLPGGPEGAPVVRVGGPALDPPGYDLRGVLIGSEGTLGIITELVVRILPSPESVVTLLAVYDDNADAARSVSGVIAAGMVPATLEMMDATVIRAVEESMPCGYPLDAAAVLIAEVDGPAVGLKQQAERIAEICRTSGCREVRQAKDASERNLLWAGRRGAFGAIARLAPNYLVADCTVPRTRLPEALARVAAIARQHQLSHGNVFHAGDGNLHPLLLFDSRDADQLRRVHQAGQQIIEACVALGGTISGEHGIGVEKSQSMRLIFSPDDLEFQRSLRGAFDPDDLLNPGKVLPPAAADDEPPEPPAAEMPEQPELTPADPHEACEMVRLAHLARTALLPMGNGRQLDFGNCCQRATVPLRSARLTSVVEYDPANQVVAAGSGISLKGLQELLAQRGQWLPVRPPWGEEGSLGGLAALGSCGPERLRYGAPRDLLLGLKFVSGTGRPISAGGRVVKNVAGYDLTRLLVGSAGTLGFITQLTFRVASLPESCTALVAAGTLRQCAAAAAELLHCRLEPALVVAVPDQAPLKFDGDYGWQLTVGLEGFQETVEFQSAGCDALLRAAGLSVRQHRTYPAREGICREFFDTLHRSSFLLRADLPLGEVSAFLSGDHQALRGAAVLVDFGCGRVLAAVPTLRAGAWLRLCETAEQNGGHLILEKAPQEFAQQQDVFGLPRPSWQVMHRIKAALDPHSVFAPGRLPGRK
jgi:glycolate oxidase subunit GlcD